MQDDNICSQICATLNWIAVAESFFGSLKNELIYHEGYETRLQAKQSIFEYIEVFYNRQRRQAFLNYLTPVECEAKYAAI